MRLFPVTLAIAVLAGPILFSPRPQNSAIAAELAEIQNRGKITIAVKDNLRPLGYRDQQENLIGLEIDIARRLATEILGDADAVNLVPVQNKDRLKVVINDDVDIAIANVTDTSSRRRLVALSPYYYLDGTGIITKDITFAKVNDLMAGTIAVLYNSSTIAVIRERLPQAKLVGVASYQEALELLEDGKVDAFAGDRTVLAGWEQEYSQYRLLWERLSGEALCIVMPKGLQYESLRSKINNAVLDWRESGWLQERIKYWGL
ncbi:periplasmic component of amino acid ABC-type transporter/signal transduction system [Xenococcus sp. PCC 7305]|uniref:transporter substrate-binding domain-containing protein n=1 Tax=Xenococcus sp. PCC 7305 TaxID=102125 RepID=UPI0002ABB260|nr:transporter substrate-binding domain-containing protein [Xenococcus sp. PCC 7305]ELS02227.1 periplasmic component of amino acid ABC-type transporter/signal transduction system [Xenococcus sp. PCC 7305]